MGTCYQYWAYVLGIRGLRATLHGKLRQSALSSMYSLPSTSTGSLQGNCFFHNFCGMKVESILHWEENNPAAWSLFVELVQTSFLGYEIPIAYSHAILVLLPKNELGKFRGITLLEVMYKLWSMIFYLRAIKVIKFHPAIHGFLRRHGCGTAILEAKLEMQWAAFNAVPYYQIFLDLGKAYYSIGCEMLDVLAGYGFGPNFLRFQRLVWAKACLVLWQMGYHGTSMNSKHGIWQGDILSPLFFNIIVDCILRQWHRQVGNDQVGKFYAGDGRLAGFDWEKLQESLDKLLALFAHVRLLPNIFKTKAMVSIGHSHPDSMSSVAFKRRYDYDNVPIYRARKLAEVQCPHCGHAMSNQYLPTHIRHVHHMVHAKCEC